MDKLSSHSQKLLKSKKDEDQKGGPRIRDVLEQIIDLKSLKPIVSSFDLTALLNQAICFVKGLFEEFALAAYLLRLTRHLFDTLRAGLTLKSHLDCTTPQDMVGPNPVKKPAEFLSSVRYKTVANPCLSQSTVG